MAIPSRVSRGALSDFIDDLQAGGRLTFTREQALAALGVTPGALKQAALRLAKRRRLVMPRRGFFVLIPLEHRAAGAPPLSAWLDDLVRFHGAHGGEVAEVGGDHVVTVDRRLRPLTCGPYRLRFEVAGR